MTRINVVDPQYLTDQHLMAEYRELPMVIGSLKRSLRSAKGVHSIPENYTLNGGHVKFFYNKGKFLKRRYTALVAELVARGYNIDPSSRTVDFDVFEQQGLDSDWQATYNALHINCERIKIRINSKKEFYRYCGQRLNTLSAAKQAELEYPAKIWL